MTSLNFVINCGEGWDVDVGQVNSNIHLKSSHGVQYWLNLPYFVQNDNWQGGILQVESESIPSGNYFELRMAIPKDQFAADPQFAQKININGLPEMERIQKDYENELNLNTGLYSIMAILMFLSIFLHVLIIPNLEESQKLIIRQNTSVIYPLMIYLL